MKIVRLPSGNTAHMLTDAEQNDIWDIISIDVNPVGKHLLYTPQDNIPYFIIEEKELSHDKFELKIKTNNKVIKVKCGICNMDVKTMKAVRKANAK